jgi:hypothetical protein
MNTRAWAGTLIWVVGFNLSIALIAFFVSVGYAIIILCIRHIVFGIPQWYSIWRKFVIGSEASSSLQIFPEKKWPNRIWVGEIVACAIISLIALLWLDLPIRDFLLKW